MSVDSDFPRSPFPRSAWPRKEPKSHKTHMRQMRQDAFVEHYAVHGDVKKAAIYAGIDSKDAAFHGNSLLASRLIKDRIIAAREERLERIGVRKDAILAQYAAIAFFDVGKLYDEYGRFLAVPDMPEDIRKIVQKIKIHERYDKDGNHLGTTTEIEVPSRLAALDNMAGAIGCKASIKVDMTAKVEINPFAAIIAAAQGNALRPATSALPAPENPISDAPSSILDADFSEIDK